MKLKFKHSSIVISIVLMGISSAHADVTKLLLNSPIGSSGQDRAVIRIWNDSASTKPVFVSPEMVRRSNGRAWPALSAPCVESAPDVQGRYSIQPGQSCSFYVQVDSSDDIVGRVRVVAPDNTSLGFVRASIEAKTFHTTVNRTELY